MILLSPTIFAKAVYVLCTRDTVGVAIAFYIVKAALIILQHAETQTQPIDWILVFLDHQRNPD